MINGNENSFGAKFTFAAVVRGELSDINELIEFLKASNLTVAHQEIGQVKLWIKRDDDND